MPDSDTSPDILPQRLCSEIQLFDLCELDACRHKIGCFCSDPILLSRFEAIADEELRPSERCILEESDDTEIDDVYDEGYNEFEMEDSDGGEDRRWQDDE
jgi:hypothetical protein